MVILTHSFSFNFLYETLKNCYYVKLWHNLFGSDEQFISVHNPKLPIFNFFIIYICVLPYPPQTLIPSFILHHPRTLACQPWLHFAKELQSNLLKLSTICQGRRIQNLLHLWLSLLKFVFASR